jgi:hypothetical protein
MQTKRMSFIESLTNIFIGYCINFTANMIVLPFFVDGFTVQDNLIVGGIYTLISLVRTYLIRRCFND